MGQGTPGGMNKQGADQQAPGDGRNDGADNKKGKKHFEPPTRVGRKQRKQKGSEAATRLPAVTPLAKCKLDY